MVVTWWIVAFCAQWIVYKDLASIFWEVTLNAISAAKRVRFIAVIISSILLKGKFCLSEVHL